MVRKIDFDADRVKDIFNELSPILDDIIKRYEAEPIDIIMVLDMLLYDIMRQSRWDLVIEPA